MTRTDPDIDVLVAGAGPTGLVLAHELLRRGVRVRVVDAKDAPATTSRAVATHPRTLEVYEQMGVVDAILERGQQVRAFTLFQDGGLLTRLDADYRRMPTRYPFTVCIDQVLTEEVLRDAVRRLGVEVEWGVRLEDLAQDATGVAVGLRGPSGRTATTRVPWLVGCDGGRSTVRKRLGFPLVGETSETWLIADADLDVDLPRNSIYWVRNRGLALMMAPMSGQRRWRLLDTAAADLGADPEEVARRFARELSAGLGRPVGVGTPSWVSVFTFQQRMIRRMRDHRCLVAGDAAHVHSPASGQGMNTGVQEAYNLAWKLAMVVRGQAHEAVLDTYSAERVPVGEALLRSTRTATGLIQLKNAAASRLLPVVFAVVRRVAPLRGRIQRKVLGGVSGLNLRYAPGPLVRAGGEGRGPRPGERVTNVPDAVTGGPAWAALAARLREPGWVLLLGPAATPPGALTPDWLTAWTVGPDGAGAIADPGGTLAGGLGLGPRAWLLVRPDGYVCARGDRFEAVALDRMLRDAGLVTTAPATR
ncbi:FAD-dependent monooxygenase [Saccharothrix australiensis]|uniref:2-polyprenyl-6-methoxyphenol hydroxylase-like FAD-dependent oxidoreductase n=1 Tax=Saccharothrix australiensis TaxID=2072 RepID=A0A495W1W9_9PSEU|nr:FAD-dependent monooxygenase [Saccharothrix australiensis]RKT55652.1 2-polyprenyl-6-methoxyphenol hydroxylase-like FAD-dependent oxidoreductase [Saccharothrix australiensis]